LIAAEHVKYQTLDEVVLPAPVEKHPMTASQSLNPLILVLIAFVAVTVLIKLAISLGCLLIKIGQKVAPKVRVFVSAQLGGEIIDFRVYQAIFD
jgi:hypothetical protein